MKNRIIIIFVCILALIGSSCSNVSNVISVESEEEDAEWVVYKKTILKNRNPELEGIVTKYDYNLNGDLVLAIDYDKNEKMIGYYIWDNEYDENSRIIQKKRIADNKDIMIENYKYLEDGSYIHEGYSSDGDREDTYYSQEGIIVKSITYPENVNTENEYYIYDVYYSNLLYPIFRDIGIWCKEDYVYVDGHVIEENDNGLVMKYYVDGTLREKHLIEIDRDRIIKITEYEINNGEESVIGYIKNIQYNKIGNIVSYEWYNKNEEFESEVGFEVDEGGYYTESANYRYTREYDEAGNLLNRKSYWYEMPDVLVNEDYYDENGNRIEFIMYEDGLPVYQEKYEYLNLNNNHSD